VSAGWQYRHVPPAGQEVIADVTRKRNTKHSSDPNWMLRGQWTNIC